MKYTKTHQFFILSGTILTITAIILSRFNGLLYTAYNSWIMESTSNEVPFMSNIFLWFGLAEILLLFPRTRFLRGLAVIVSFFKVSLPWFLIFTRNFIGHQLSDSTLSYSLLNALPFFITALAVLSFAQNIAMYFILSSKKTPN